MQENQQPLVETKEKTSVTSANVHRNIILRPRKSNFVAPFTKVQRGIVCCPFMKLAFANGCMYTCDYCYLRGTFRTRQVPSPTLFTNFTDALIEVEEFLFKTTQPMILHTGELADSLAIPGSSAILRDIIALFARQREHKLLLLTKSVNVDELLGFEHNGQTVVGFSLNPSEVAKEYESDAPPPEKRLEAAEHCIDAGYPVMFRLDPMIPIDNWTRIYERFLDVIEGRRILGLAIGTLRAYSNLLPQLPSSLRVMVTERNFDGRWRLPLQLRVSMYDMVMSRLDYDRIGICKESGEIWGKLASKHKKKFLCNCRL